MMLDFLRNTNQTLSIANGDLVIGDATLLQIELLLFSSKGEIRNNPLVGINVNNYIGITSNKLRLRDELKSTLINSGYPVERIDYVQTNNELNFDIQVKQ